MSNKKNIVGDRVLGSAQNIELNINVVQNTNNKFWSTIGSEVLGVTALPSYGGYITEEKLSLLGDLHGKRVLDVCCGNGHSLKYVYDKGANELWGIDISQEQINRTQEFLVSKNINANLICSPMENDCGIPKNYFDVVYSVFGIGWTTDLNKTLKQINSYLKIDGIFIFNWSHPIHKCTIMESSNMIISNSYFDESWYSATIGGKEVMLSNRMMSTYVNALADNGFMIERLIEKNDDDLINADNSPFREKAKVLPVSFVIKAKKVKSYE